MCKEDSYYIFNINKIIDIYNDDYGTEVDHLIIDNLLPNMKTNYDKLEIELKEFLKSMSELHNIIAEDNVKCAWLETQPFFRLQM